MKLLLKILKRSLLVMAGLVLLALAIIVIRSALLRHKTYNVPLVDIAVPRDAASIAEGFRQTRIAHCNDCHGENLEGTVLKEAYFNVVRRATPNIPRVIAGYSDAELARVIRHGIKKNGTAAIMMPADMYIYLKDESVADMIAYLRSIEQQPLDPDRSGITIGPFVYLELVTNKRKLPQDTVDHFTPRLLAQQDTNPLAHGKYLAFTVCSHCHGADLEGKTGMNAPSLRIVAAYTLEQFQRLLRTGVPISEADLPLMGRVARESLRYLTDDEIKNLHDYLRNRPVDGKEADER